MACTAGSRQLILCLVSWMITTPRLLVRRLSLADYESFAALERDPEVKKFSGGPRVIPQDGYARLVSTDSDACLAVFAREDGRFVGRCGLRPVDDRMELEIFLVPTSQADRVGSELFDALVAYCHTTFPDMKIAATVAPANTRAIRLLESHGFSDARDTVHTKAGFQSLYVQSS